MIRFWSRRLRFTPTLKSLVVYARTAIAAYLPGRQVEQQLILISVRQEETSEPRLCSDAEANSARALLTRTISGSIVNVNLSVGCSFALNWSSSELMAK